jgi:excisionase family DNA binding protein
LSKRPNIPDIETFLDLITSSEAARLRGVSRAAINDLTKRGKLTAHRLYGRVLVSRKEVLEFRPATAGRKTATTEKVATKKPAVKKATKSKK